MNNNFFEEIFDSKYAGPPKVVAEISANHDGSERRLIQTMDAALSVGCDAVKIQSYTADTMTLNCAEPEFTVTEGLWKGRTLYDLYKQGETPFEWHRSLFDHAKKIKIPLFSTPFDETAVDLLESLDTPIYKIGSPELCDLSLIKYIAKTGKPVILSTGMARLEEIDAAVEVCRRYKNLHLILHCVSTYPTKLHDSQLLNIQYLSKRYDAPIGLSDHTLTNLTAILAVALGVKFIEKHFTLDKDDAGIDSAFSLDPVQMESLVSEVRNAHASLGRGSVFTKSENALSNRKYMRSLYFVQDLPAGTIIESMHVKRVRPGEGLPCSAIDSVIGRRLLRDVEYGMPVRMNAFRND
jgi:pseudaminic acid synthase